MYTFFSHKCNNMGDKPLNGICNGPHLNIHVGSFSRWKRLMEPINIMWTCLGDNSNKMAAIDVGM